jgi:hypothetical protein
MNRWVIDSNGDLSTDPFYTTDGAVAAALSEESDVETSFGTTQVSIGGPELGNRS